MPHHFLWKTIIISLTYQFHLITGRGNVFYLDGSVKCYVGTHLLVTVIAVCVLFIVVLPPPIMVPLAVNGQISLNPSITDALTQGLRYAILLYSQIISL